MSRTGSGRALGGGSKSARTPFIIEIFADDIRQGLSDRKSAMYRALDEDAKTTPDQMDYWYAYSDQLRDVIAEGYDRFDEVETEKAARKIAADMKAQFNALVAQYRKAEAKRAKEAPKLEAKREAQAEAEEINRLIDEDEAREAAIAACPELADRDDWFLRRLPVDRRTAA